MGNSSRPAMGCESSRIEGLENQIKELTKQNAKQKADISAALSVSVKELEIKMELVSMYEKIDTNSDGELSVAELSNVSYFLAENKKWEGKLSKATGTISKQDFIDFWLEEARTPDYKFGNWGKVQPQLRALGKELKNEETSEDEKGDPAKQRAYLDKVFKSIDLDGNGDLSKNELTAVCNRIVGNLISGTDFYDQVRNGEDKISPDTWAAHWLGLVESNKYTWRTIRADVRKFKTDAILAKRDAEAVAAMASKSEQAQEVLKQSEEKKAKELFAAIDADGDGNVTLQELKEWAEAEGNVEEAKTFMGPTAATFYDRAADKPWFTGQKDGGAMDAADKPWFTGKDGGAMDAKLNEQHFVKYYIKCVQKTKGDLQSTF